MAETKRSGPHLGVMALAFATLCMMLLAVQTVTKILTIPRLVDGVVEPPILTPMEAYAGLLTLLAIGLIALGLFFFKPFVQTISSFRFACFLMLVITVFTVAGTLVVQTESRVEFQKKYGAWFIDMGVWEGGDVVLKKGMAEEQEAAILNADPVYRGVGNVFDFLEKLHFNDIYHAWWYDGLLILLMLGAISSAVTRYNRSTRKIGLVLTHCSIAVILAGSLVGDYFGATKGYLLIKQGETRDHFVPTDRGQNRGAGVSIRALENPKAAGILWEDLGFSVTLNEFDKSEHKKTFKLYYAVRERVVEEEPEEPEDHGSHDHKPGEHKSDEDKPTFTWGRWNPAWVAGKDRARRDATDTRTGRVRLVGSKYQAIVRRFFVDPALKLDQLFISRSDTPLRPAVHVRASNPGSPYGYDSYLMDRGMWPSLDRETKIVFSWAEPEEGGLAAYARHGPRFKPMTGTLEVQLPGGKKQTLSFTLGDEIQVPGTRYSIRATRYEPNYVLVGKVARSRSQYPDNPAVLLQIFEEKDGRKTNIDPLKKGVWRFLNRPDARLEQTRRVPPLVVPFNVKLTRSKHWKNFRNTFIIYGSARTVSLIRDRRVVGTWDIRPDAEMGFPGTAVRLTLGQPIADAVLNVDVTDRAAGRADQGADLVNPLIFVDLFEGDSRTVKMRLPLWGTTNPNLETHMMVDNTLLLWFKPQDVMPAGFRSTITIARAGKTLVDKQVVSMNHPFVFERYALYQSSWGTEQRTPGGPITQYSVFQVVKDPGVEIVYLGFLSLVIGLILMLVVHPWRRARARAATAGPEKEPEPARPGSNETLDIILYILGFVMLGFLALLLFVGFKDPVDRNNFLRAPEWFRWMIYLSAPTALIYIINSFAIKSRLLGWCALSLFLAAFAANTGFLVHGWIEAKHAPINTFFTASTYVSWVLMLSTLAFQLLTRTPLVGGLATTAILGMHLFALDKFDPEYAPVPPSLKSAWFVPHVSVYILGYSILTVGALTGLLYLITPKIKTLTARNAYIFGGVHVDLERRAYKTITYGFIFLTCGLLSGAWWAKGAWGDYWFWDPKETWGLVSWLTFLIFLHLRFVRGWVGKKAMVFCLIGALAVGFTYFAMKHLPSADLSVHIYTGD